MLMAALANAVVPCSRLALIASASDVLALFSLRLPVWAAPGRVSVPLLASNVPAPALTGLTPGGRLNCSVRAAVLPAGATSV
jgi:hypothetical protein